MPNWGEPTARATGTALAAVVKFKGVACGFGDVGTGVTKSDVVQVVLSTASPAKFPDTIRATIGTQRGFAG